MKKFLFGVIVVIIVGIVVVALPKHAKEKESDYRDEGKTEEVVDDSDEFTIEPLSDKDIYFKADTTLPNIPLINDMLDVANSFAIMRAAYCDAELWFRFRMTVNDEIDSLKTDIIKDKAIRTAAEKYVKDLVKILPKDTILYKQSDSILWDKVWKAYMTYGDKLSSRFALDHYGKITKKDVVNYMAIRQFIPNYDSIYNLRHNQSEENERYLLMMAEQTPNFDRECLYTVEYAHQRRHEEPHNAIPMLEKLMESGRFSRYLHEVWRTWRYLRQVAESPSRDGNGRTGRLLSNFILLKAGHPLLIIKLEDRSEYISALKQIRTEGTDERLRVGELCSGMHLVAFFFKTAIDRMKSELAQKRKNTLPTMFF